MRLFLPSNMPVTNPRLKNDFVCKLAVALMKSMPVAKMMAGRNSLIFKRTATTREQIQGERSVRFRRAAFAGAHKHEGLTISLDRSLTPQSAMSARVGALVPV